MAMRALEITRTQHERRSLPLAQGAQIAIGARRLHVLPTPLSSFLACGATEADAAALAREPLLESLSTRMKTRVGLRAIDGLTGTPAPFAGVAAIAGGAGRRDDSGMAAAPWRIRSAGPATQCAEPDPRHHPLDR